MQGRDVDFAQAIAAARRELPPLAVDDATLAAHVARCAGARDEPQEGDGAGEDATDTSALRVTDLVLACACGQGDAAALAHFDATYQRELRAALSRLRGGRDFDDEVLQLAREKLFVGPSPRILEYRGRGTLRAWLRAVVVRTALNARRRKLTEPEPPANDDALLDIAAPAGDPETAQILAKYGPAYKQALHDALAELPPEDRNVLRLSLLEGLGIDAIARLYDVHRATVARWIARSRDAVADGARARLGERTRLRDGELASVARACRTGLELSLVRALETTRPSREE